MMKIQQLVKKKKRKYSNSELECRIQIDNNGEDEWKLLTAPPCEEIFSMLPKKKTVPRKRTTKTTAKPKIIKEKPIPTTIVRKRTVPVKLRNSKSIISTIESQPLATSSPVDNTTPRNIDKQTVASSVVAVDDDNNDIQKTTETNKNKKRKVTDNQDNNQVEIKKPRPAVPNHEDLLTKSNLEKLMECIHGPEN